jgi:hypothetical protein
MYHLFTTEDFTLSDWVDFINKKFFTYILFTY